MPESYPVPNVEKTNYQERCEPARMYAEVLKDSLGS